MYPMNKQNLHLEAWVQCLLSADLQAWKYCRWLGPSSLTSRTTSKPQPIKVTVLFAQLIRNPSHKATQTDENELEESGRGRPRHSNSWGRTDYLKELKERRSNKIGGKSNQVYGRLSPVRGVHPTPDTMLRDVQLQCNLQRGTITK